MPTSTQNGLELFRAGETVRYTAEYALFDAQGSQQDFQTLFLEEGETFPALKAQQAEGLCYGMVETGSAEDRPIGGPTPETD